MDKYSTDPRTEVKKSHVDMQILATRGCPNQCTFCSSRTDRSLGTKYRMRTPRLVVDEMEYLFKKYNSRVFSFMDLAFPLVRSRAIELCDEIIARGLNKKIRWITECRVKPLDQALLYKLKEAGCVRINFGIESGNDHILKELKKNFTVEDVRRAVEMASMAGIEIDGMFMIGLPNETEETIKKTVALAITLDLRYAIFNLFVPYPGCDLFEELMKKNNIHFRTWDDFTSYPTYSGGKPVYVPDGLTHAQLMGLQKYAMKKFYLRPRFIFQELGRLKLSQITSYWQGLKAVISN
jgi:anaerobic magnesium-protoporphyrin IX monomethyl ester cyclase